MTTPTNTTPSHLIATCKRCQSLVTLEPFIAEVLAMLEGMVDDEDCDFSQERVAMRRVLVALIQGDLVGVGEAIYEVDDFANVFSDANCDLPVFLGITS